LQKHLPKQIKTQFTALAFQQTRKPNVITKTFSFPANQKAKWKHKDLAFQQIRKPDGSTKSLEGAAMHMPIYKHVAN